ncbi:MAG: peptidoglycan editing factor PgeF [Bdellovibrionota bacterium]
MPVTSNLLLKIRGLTHSFGDRNEPVPTLFKSQWDQSGHLWKQTHGTEMVLVTIPKQVCGEVDILYTRSKGLPIAVVTADCVPIILAKKDGKAAAVIHAGWRGTQAGIVNVIWSKLSAEGENPGQWVAAVGPAIGPCCYEVSEDLAQQFESKFGMLGNQVAVPTHRRLDLPAINTEILKGIGFADVDLIRACTRCSRAAEDPTFNSYRRDGAGTRQYSVALLK